MLNLPYSFLDEVRRSRDTEKVKLSSVLERWMQSESEVTYAVIIDALRGEYLNEQRVANTIFKHVINK